MARSTLSTLLVSLALAAGCSAEPDLGSAPAGGCTPAPETCNGVDDDCDGAVDEADGMSADARLGVPCFGDPDGLCAAPQAAGLTACVAGSIACAGPGVRVQDQVAEACNGVDDDCDGTVDDGDPEGGGPCSGGEQGCGAGTLHCQGGSLVCVYAAVDDGDACTTDACDPLTLEVSHAPVDPDDGNACTVDACDPLAGVTHVAVPLQPDLLDCTIDACDPASGEMVHAPDSSRCGAQEFCSPRSGCEPTLTAFGPDPVFVYVGTGWVVPPLRVERASASGFDAPVSISSSAPGVAFAPDGVATILAGVESATVTLRGVELGGQATLTAAYGERVLTTRARVIDDASDRSVESLTAASAAVPAGGAVLLTVTLDLPARIGAGGEAVALSVAPAGAGTLPAAVLVQPWERTATFAYADGGAALAATVTARLGTSTASATLNAPP